MHLRCSKIKLHKNTVLLGKYDRPYILTWNSARNVLINALKFNSTEYNCTQVIID